MSDKLRFTIASVNTSATLRVTEDDQGVLSLAIISGNGLITGSIHVKKAHLYPEAAVPFGEFDFPTTPGTKFSAVCGPFGQERQVFTTYTDGNGSIFYRDDENFFYQKDEFSDDRDFRLESE